MIVYCHCENEWKDSAFKKNIKTKALQSKSRKQQTLLGVSVHEVDRKKTSGLH